MHNTEPVQYRYMCVTCHETFTFTLKLVVLKCPLCNNRLELMGERALVR